MTWRPRVAARSASQYVSATDVAAGGVIKVTVQNVGGNPTANGTHLSVGSVGCLAAPSPRGPARRRRFLPSTCRRSAVRNRYRLDKKGDAGRPFSLHGVQRSPHVRTEGEDLAAPAAVRSGLRQRLAHRRHADQRLSRQRWSVHMRSVWQRWCAGLLAEAIDVSGHIEVAGQGSDGEGNAPIRGA